MLPTTGAEGSRSYHSRTTSGKTSTTHAPLVPETAWHVVDRLTAVALVALSVQLLLWAIFAQATGGSAWPLFAGGASAWAAGVAWGVRAGRAGSSPAVPA